MPEMAESHNSRAAEIKESRREKVEKEEDRESNKHLNFSLL